MNKVININFQGRILPIEEMAYEMLKQYIESLRIYFANEEGRDEIINDIECRIAELCEDRLKKGTVCIAEQDMNLIIASIGRPADFEAQDGFEANTSQSQQSSAQNTSHNSYTNFESADNRPKRLYRDEQNKVLGGVCSGIANYFGIEPLVVRILWFFLICVNIIGYLILTRDHYLKIAIKEEFQNRGIGTAMVAQFIEICITKNFANKNKFILYIAKNNVFLKFK
jgi:phage shock protein PspC (stress-responsive transcriptional regulator)